MPTFQVEVQRTIVCTVTVEADDADAAMAVVDDASYQLPAAHECDYLDGNVYVVYDESGDDEITRSD